MVDLSGAAEVDQVEFDASDPEHVRRAVALWNEATGNELPITERFLRYNCTADAGVTRGGWIALVEGRPAGFLLCSAYPGAPLAMRSDVAGWIEAVAVAPAFQRRGIGKKLLARGVAWVSAFANRDVAGRIRAGGGLRPFVPGPMADSGAEAFFLDCGFRYDEEPYSWDVARTLSDYRPPMLSNVPAAARPGQPGQASDLVRFLAREFPGRWHWQAERFLEEGGRISDYMLLWTEEGVQGSCRLTFEDSASPIDRFYPYGLPRPWAQLGSIGVSAHLRGQGMGIYLLDAGLRRLHNSGINGCVIDWTTLLGFYAKCGFHTYRKWAQLGRSLRGNG